MISLLLLPITVFGFSTEFPIDNYNVAIEQDDSFRMRDCTYYARIYNRSSSLGTVNLTFWSSPTGDTQTQNILIDDSATTNSFSTVYTIVGDGGKSFNAAGVDYYMSLEWDSSTVNVYLTVEIFCVGDSFEGIYSETDYYQSFQDGYSQGYSDGYDLGTSMTVETVNTFSLIRGAFNAVGNFFNLQIFPGITIGTIALVPLVVGVLYAVLKLFAS